MIPTIIQTDQPPPRARDAILRRLVDFNAEQSGYPKEYRTLAILLSHPDDGTILGGLWARSQDDHMYVELLFIPEELRRTGLGRRLMADAEAEAIRRGCRSIWLDTFSFQARGFYERLGYTVYGTIEDFPPGHHRFFMKKTFTTGAGTPPMVE